MKPAKHLPTTRNKLPDIPEVTYKKGQLNSPSLPKAKEKPAAKLVKNKIEPMSVQSPPTTESILRYALPIPSNKTGELAGEDDVHRIIRHLKMVASTLEKAYGFNFDNEELVVRPEQEDLCVSVGDDMNSFLVCCSQFAAQLEEAVKEEHHILESLFKWFQRQVNQMEEISKDHNILEEDLPAPDKSIVVNIAQIVKLMQKLQKLRNNLSDDGFKYSWKAIMPKSMRDEERPSTKVDSCESVEQQIKEFIKAHSTEEPMDVSATESLAADSSMASQVNEMLKIFEKQANELERAKNDQSLLEAKCKQMESDLEVLLEEKTAMENELQRLKDTEKSMHKTKPMHDQAKKAGKTEKKKDKEKHEDSEEKMTIAQQHKMKDIVLQVQKVADDLKVENKALQEQLKQALLEAARAKNQIEYPLDQEAEFIKSDENKGIVTMFADKMKAISKINSLGLKKNDNVQEYPQTSVVQSQRPLEERS